MEPRGTLPCSQEHNSSKTLCKISQGGFFYGERLLAPRPTPKLEDHALSANSDCLFNTFTAALHIWRPSLPSWTRGRTMQWWQGPT